MAKILSSFSLSMLGVNVELGLSMSTRKKHDGILVTSCLANVKKGLYTGSSN